MPHFGVVCPPTSGHLNPMMALGRALAARGHRVTVFAIADIQPRVREEGLEFSAIGEQECPLGSLPVTTRRMAELQGLAAMRFSLEHGRRLAELMCRYAPEAMRHAGIELLIVDQNEPAGGTVAEHLGLPFVNVVSLPVNREPGVPPPFVPWQFSGAAWAQWRNRLGYAVFDFLVRPVTREINSFRVPWNLAPIRIPDDTFSRLAQISQLTREFDFPRRELPKCFHYTGPFLDTKRPPIAFPFDRLDGRHLVYVSFGTLLTKLAGLLHKVAEACAALDVQVVISLGSAEAGNAVPEFAGNPIVVPFAPQLEILRRARLMINHGGLNSVQEALHYGVPMVSIPITNDQPAVSARLERSGAGRAIPIGRVTVANVGSAVREVLTVDSYRRNAGRLQQSIIAAGGVERAADIVEQTGRTGKR